jgi:hypothetical protein
MGLPRPLFACAAIVLASCHLADDLDPPNCGPGTHVENRRCVQDPIDGPQVAILPASGGTSCAGDPSAQRPPVVDPESFQVGAGVDFRFVNRDVVDHEIRGVDGQVWVTVKAGHASDFTSIQKAGSWGYRVSGCAKTSQIVVQ